MHEIFHLDTGADQDQDIPDLESRLPITSLGPLLSQVGNDSTGRKRSKLTNVWLA
jgi:hypothetical protein